MNCREGKSPEIIALLYKWYLAVYSLCHRRIPITTALREEAACMKAGRLSIVGFAANNGYVRGFLKRYVICNLAMHGQAGATNLAAAAAAVEHIRRQLEAYPQDRIYNMDETELLTCVCRPGRTCPTMIAGMREASRPCETWNGSPSLFVRTRMVPTSFLWP